MSARVPDATRTRPRWFHVAACVVVVAISFAQEVGKTTFDTKLDLTADPVAALRRAFSLWDVHADFGSLGNQAYGYLFPQGAWFALWHTVGLADWVSQRLWSALVLLIAYDGARRLARAVHLEPEAVQVVAGLAFATAPRLIGLSGALTGEILPSAVLPWVCLPVVLALDGRLSARRAGVLSALAIVCMGGVNAAENLAALPLPLLLVVSGLRTPGGGRLARWWVGCVALAGLWWMLPLLLLGRYSPPFLDYIETAYATTRPTGWSNALRGAEHWVGYIFVGGRPWWHGLYAMATSPALVIAAGLVAALGLVGLFESRMPRRVPLGASVLLGLLLLTVGHGGVAGTPLAGDVRDLLDGPLAAFRNVHKVDPLIRLPLALGLAHLLGLARSAAAHWRRPARSERATGMPVEQVRTVLTASVVLLLAASVAPVFANTLRQPGWSAVPPAWRQAARWLDHDGPGATLVLPSTSFGQQTWGWTVDEPIQALVSSGWVARSQIPLIPPSSIRFLDGIEQRLEDGLGSTALAATLASAGVSRVLVRNDVDVAAADVADPARVAAALQNSPGLRAVRSFGSSDDPRLPLLQVYRVDGAQTAPRLTTTSGLPLLTGAPEDVITAKEAGVLPATAQVRVGEPTAGRSPDVVTDGYRRVVRQFGRFHDATSQVMTLDEPYRGGRKVSDFAGVPGVPRVYAEYADLRAVTASSSAGYADTVGQVRPELGPASAVDGDDATYWRSAPFEPAVGQWVQLDFRQAQPVGLVNLTLAVDGIVAAPVTRVEVDAGGQHRQLAVDQRTGRVAVNLDGVRASSLRVTVLAASGNDPEAAVAIRDIDVAGLDTQRSLVVPDAGATGSTSFVFSAEPPRRACLFTVSGPSCDAFAARPGAEQGRVSRVFTTHGSGSWDLHGQAVALSSPGAAQLLHPLGDAVAATSTSVLADDPQVSAQFAVDGDRRTAWLANLGDDAPTLNLSWRGPRTLDRLRVDPAEVPSLTPYEAVIQAGDQTRVVALGATDTGYFPPLRATSATITFHAYPDPTGALLPVGVGEVRLDGLQGLVQPVALTPSFASLCGLGPTVVVDGVAHRTRVTGSLRDVVDGRPVTWTACDGGPVALGPGQHHLAVSATSAFTPTMTVLQSRAARSFTTPGAVEASTPLASSMRLRLAARDQATVLTFDQNANPGWVATLGDTALRPTTIDGWQQGFLVPPGGAASVQLRFAPSGTYRLALAVGALGVAALVALLLLDLRRPSSVRLVPTSRPHRPRARRTTWAAAGLVTVVLVVVGGPVFGLGAAAAAVGVRRRGGRVFVLVAGGVLVFASAVAAVYSPRIFAGTPTGLADVLAALGAALLVATLVGASEEDSRVAG